MDPRPWSSLFSCEQSPSEVTKTLSPKSWLSGITSVRPSSRSAVDLSDSKKKDGDTCQPPSEGARAHHWSWIRQAGGLKLLLSGRMLLWKPHWFSGSISLNLTSGTVKIPVIRHGTDLSTFTSVWCATRPSDPASATPGVDYVPSSRKVEFGPGVTEQVSIQGSKADGSVLFLVCFPDSLEDSKLLLQY